MSRRNYAKNREFFLIAYMIIAVAFCFTIKVDSVSAKVAKPKKVTLKSVAANGKSAITVKWKKAKKKELNTFQGYEIQYTLDGTFKDYPAKKVGKKKASATLKKLLKKKKYKVRIRRYRDDGKVLHVSPWKMKKGKTK